ncbi:hypothetical protein N7G274_003233 [Stereocaulon virgatum]|uniref:Uncharacterized protein n=1 Tax=Stereocaulon virgatum TaxID=373712 RepID=A0ABR4AG94_9LECA
MLFPNLSLPKENDLEEPLRYSRELLGWSGIRHQQLSTLLHQRTPAVIPLQAQAQHDSSNMGCNNSQPTPPLPCNKLRSPGPQDITLLTKSAFTSTTTVHMRNPPKRKAQETRSMNMAGHEVGIVADRLDSLTWWRILGPRDPCLWEGAGAQLLRIKSLRGVEGAPTTSYDGCYETCCIHTWVA